MYTDTATEYGKVMTGEDLVEHYTIAGMGHGVPIDPDGEGGCGNAAPWIVNAGISSSHHIAKFWGLTTVSAERPVDSPSGRSGGARRSGECIRRNG